MSKKQDFEKLRAAMIVKGDDYGTIAALLGVSEASIRRRFNREVMWTINEVRTICEYYGKTFEELFT